MMKKRILALGRVTLIMCGILLTLASFNRSSSEAACYFFHFCDAGGCPSSYFQCGGGCNDRRSSCISEFGICDGWPYQECFYKFCSTICGA